MDDSDITSPAISDKLMSDMHADYADAIRCQSAITEEELTALAARESAAKPKPQVRVTVYGKKFKVESRSPDSVRWTSHGTYPTEPPAQLAAIKLLSEAGAA
jgi:hypothetical protein